MTIACSPRLSQFWMVDDDDVTDTDRIETSLTLT